MRNASGHRNSSVIVDLAMGHIPRSTERISSTLCSKKSDAKIQITITMAYLIRIKYFLNGLNYHLSDVNVANFNKIHRTIPEQQLF